MVFKKKNKEKEEYDEYLGSEEEEEEEQEVPKSVPKFKKKAPKERYQVYYQPEQLGILDNDTEKFVKLVSNKEFDEEKVQNENIEATKLNQLDKLTRAVIG
jgi:hypothetical protein